MLSTCWMKGQKKTLDELLSFGELLSSRVISEYLNKSDIETSYIDAREFIKTNSNFGEATPNYSESKKNIQSIKLNDNSVLVTQGFIASDNKSNTTTMGFESSNLSAMIFSEALNIDSIEIITKSNGIYSLDPEQFKNAVKLSELNYDAAIRLSKNGLKLFYPGMIELAKQNNIKIIYRGLSESNGTQINSNSKDNETVILKNKDRFILAPVNKKKLKTYLGSDQFRELDFKYESEGSILTILSKELDEMSLNYFFNLSF